MYFANSVFEYNKKKYQAGQPISDFGVGKYDDILLETGQVVSDGKGTGVEDKISNLKKWRKDNQVDIDTEAAEEQRFMADARRFEAEVSAKLEEQEQTALKGQ